MARDFLLGKEDEQIDAMDRQKEGRKAAKKEGRKEGKFSCMSFHYKY